MGMGHNRISIQPPSNAKMTCLSAYKVGQELCKSQDFLENFCKEKQFVIKAGFTLTFKIKFFAGLCILLFRSYPKGKKQLLMAAE